MKKIYLLSGVILGSVLLAGCKKSSTDSTTPSSTPPPAGESGSMSDKLKSWTEAVKLGGGLKCTFTNTKTNQKSQYVAKGKKMHMKGFTMSGDESETSGEMINDGSFMYTWDNIKKEGFKVVLPSEEEMKASADKAKDALKNAPKTPDFTSEESVKKLEDDGVKMDCSPGVINDAEFVPPTDVKFQDFSTMMQDSFKKAQEGLTDEQKQQLLNAPEEYDEDL